MSGLTKIFVVVLAFFSIAFTSATVSMVARTANWKDTAEKYREHAKVADTNLRHEIAAGAALLAAARDEVHAAQAAAANTAKKLESSRNENATFKAQVLLPSDTHAADEVAVPKWFEYQVGKTQNQQILDHFLTQVMIDPIGLVLDEHPRHGVRQLVGGLPVPPERFF